MSEPRMTKEFLKDHCEKKNLPSTPYLVNILYLNSIRFSTIENLEEFTGLKNLFLNNNSLQRIENLDALSDLSELDLHENSISKLENLQTLTKLRKLNVSHNDIHVIENISCLPDLRALDISHNKLESVCDIEHLRQCQAIRELDLSHNMLRDPEIISVLEAMPNLLDLNLVGNEVVENIPDYRETVIARLKKLAYFDTETVYSEERERAEAWARAGPEERKPQQTDNSEKVQDSLDEMAPVQMKTDF